MKVISWFAVFSVFVFYSCTPAVNTKIYSQYEPLDYREEVFIYSIHEEVPENSEEIGEVKVGDTGFTTKCDYGTVLNEALMAARKAGGNAIKVTAHKSPDFFSTCHTISVKILKVGNQPAYFVEEKAVPEIDSVVTDYATLHLYRFKGMGSLVGYDLYLNDSIICRVKNNWGETVRIKKDGNITLWAKTETKVELPLYLEPGKEYYIRCGIGMGFLVGRPDFVLVDPKMGKYEFEAALTNQK